MKKKKLKIKPLGIKVICSFIALIIITIIIVIIVNINSFEHKLKKIGYNKDEISTIISNKDQKIINYVLNNKYITDLYEIMTSTYYMKKHIYDYLDYKKENKDKSINDIISIINVGANNDWYDNPKVTDTSLNELSLVNKFNYLNDDFAPNDIITVSNWYAYADVKISNSIYAQYKAMCEAASEEGLKLIASSGFRTFKSQKSIYDNYAIAYGEEKTDQIAARAGYSEHQLGLSLDILTNNTTTDNFDQSEEAKWLKSNSYKYGFILRYPEDKEYLTGYSYEPWHYRYVGIDAAQKIYNENITFDEYYAYYIEK